MSFEWSHFWERDSVPKWEAQAFLLGSPTAQGGRDSSFTERHQNRESSREWVSWEKGKSGCYYCLLQVPRSVATGVFTLRGSAEVLISSLFCSLSSITPFASAGATWVSEKEALQLNFIFPYYLVISSHSGFSSCLPPSADIVILKYPQGIKIIWERRKELNFWNMLPNY